MADALRMFEPEAVPRPLPGVDPFLLLDRRSAFITSSLTIIPGLLGGVVVLVFGVSL